ncbi:MAG: hypothetical protein DHS20C15_08500 [Planctomycetota bacterium]|nr:MAG: hypothetical protein DHS20C15_08500 [Planctomycetota bacterium]
MLTEWGLPSDRVAAWEMAVSELTTNVFRHSYKNLSPGVLGLSLNWDDTGLTISVIDEGHPFDPNLVPPPPDPDPADPRTWPEGGMGLMMVRSAGDDLRYASTGKRNVLSLFTALPRVSPA